MRPEPHPPFDDGEAHHQQAGQLVLHHLRVAQAVQQADLAERPGLGVRAQEDEAGQADEDQRPVPRQGDPAGRVQQRREADQQHHHPGPVVVVLGPGDVLGVARRQQALAGGEGLRLGRLGRLAPLPFGIQLRLQGGKGQVGMARAVEARPGRGEALGDLAPGHPVLRQVGGRGDGGEGGGDGEHGDAEDDLRLDEAADPQQPGLGRRAAGAAASQLDPPSASSIASITALVADMAP